MPSRKLTLDPDLKKTKSSKEDMVQSTNTDVIASARDTSGAGGGTSRQNFEIKVHTSCPSLGGIARTAAFDLIQHESQDYFHTDPGGNELRYNTLDTKEDDAGPNFNTQTTPNTKIEFLSSQRLGYLSNRDSNLSSHSLHRLAQ